MQVERFEELRAEVRSGALRGRELLSRLESVAPIERDRWVERLLGIDAPPVESDRARGELMGYHACGVGAVLQLIRDAPIGADDVFVDVGSGLGKVAMLVNLLTGARAHGLELDPQLAALARARAADLALADVAYTVGDARERVLYGNVYFLYLPFTGAALETAMARLEAHTRGRSVVVCTVGLDLARFAWLGPCESAEFWTSIHRRREHAAVVGATRVDAAPRAR